MALLVILLLLGHISGIAPLRCYSCVFPALSPADCLKYPQECPAGQRCLSSTAVGMMGSIRVVLYEKSCAIPSHCGMTGQKHTAGFNFTYSSECCDTDLCNDAFAAGNSHWHGAPLGLLLPVVFMLS